MSFPQASRLSCSRASHVVLPPRRAACSRGLLGRNSTLQPFQSGGRCRGSGPAAPFSAADSTRTSAATQSMVGAEQEPRVAVITTVGCPYCKKAKAALDAASIPYREYELSEQVEVLSKVKAATGQATVPQVFVGGKLLGGASDIVPLAESGGLRQLLADAAAPPLPAELAAVLEEAAAARQAEQEAAEDPEAERLRELASNMRAAALGGARGAPFTAATAAAWLREAQGLSAEEAGASLGALQAVQLLTVAEPAAADEALGAATTPGLQLRLVADCPPPSRWKDPLNGQFTWFGPARPAAEVAESLRRRILALFDAHLVQGGRKVDYAALRADPAFADFAAAAAELQKVDLSQLATRDQRIAFFVNTYNALVVHALAVFGPADGSLARLKWFDSVSYVIDGARWSSNDIEHGALRGNAPSPASLFSLLGKPQWAGRTFKAGDPRAALAVTPVDPRIHFALNCGAASCPPIRVYTPESLDFGLGEAARAFCAGEVTVDAGKEELELSMILKWYGPDFGTKEQLLHFLADHLPEGPQEELRGLLQRCGADGIALRFRPYDWTTNAAD